MLIFIFLFSALYYLFVKRAITLTRFKLDMTYSKLLFPIVFIGLAMIYQRYSVHVIHILFFFCLIVLSFIDIKLQEIPDRCILCIFLCSLFLFIQEKQSIASFLFPGLLFFIPFSLLYSIRSDSLGFGDIKLFLVGGLYVGFPRILVAFCIAIFSATIFGIFLLWRYKEHQFAFGPFISIGLFLSICYGDIAIALYQSVFI